MRMKTEWMNFFFEFPILTMIFRWSLTSADGYMLYFRQIVEFHSVQCVCQDIASDIYFSIRLLIQCDVGGCDEVRIVIVVTL